MITNLGHCSFKTAKFSVLGVDSLQVVWDGKASEDGQTLIPNVEHGAHGLDEGDVKCVQVLGAHGVIEGQVAGVVVQQDADASQVRRRLDGQLFAVVANHPGVVATAEDPRGRVLADPLVLRGGFVGDAHSVPRAPSDQSLPVVPAAVDVDVSHHTVAALAGEAVLTVAFLRRGLVSLHRQVVMGHLQLLVGRFGIQLERLAVGLESPRFTAPASRLVDGLDNKDILGAALQSVHCVVVLLDVGNNHPTLQ